MIGKATTRYIDSLPDRKPAIILNTLRSQIDQSDPLHSLSNGSGDDLSLHPDQRQFLVPTYVSGGSSGNDSQAISSGSIFQIRLFCESSACLRNPTRKKKVEPLGGDCWDGMHKY